MLPTPKTYRERNGILSDREIRRLCIKPEYVLTHPSGFEEFISAPYTEYEEYYINKLSNPASTHDHNPNPIRPVTKKELAEFRPMLTPFVNNCIREEKFRDIGDEDFEYSTKKVISYGLSSYGYDLRAANEFKIFTNVNSAIADPKNFDSKAFVDFTGDVCIIPPNSFILARTMEKMIMPRNVVADFITKSTYARVGVATVCTPAEPGWVGYLTLEFANTSPLPVKFYAKEGCVQMRCFRANDCDVTYADRQGKYMNQKAEVTLPRT